MSKNRKATSVILFSSCFLVAAVAVYHIYAMFTLSGSGDGAANRPSAFQTLEEENRGAGQVTLHWDAVPNAAFYNVYWSKSPGSAKGRGNKISNAAIPTTINNLEIGTTYYFYVTAVNKSGESAASEEIAYTVDEK